jgi:hypothetical protein
MKTALRDVTLPDDGLLILCASHEERSKALATQLGPWSPSGAVMFHYADSNDLGRRHHAEIVSALDSLCPLVECPFDENRVIENFDSHKKRLRATIEQYGTQAIVIDVSVLTKRHLLLLLRWLDDCNFWNRLWLVYTEPEEYEIEGSLPLSFGVSSVEQLPGFPSSPNPSRPLHAVMFLGYEGDRAFATYELLQPKKTTVIIPDPPFKVGWRGRTESLNSNLLSAIGQYSLESADSLDPESSKEVLVKVCGDPLLRSEFSRALCPLGTKPQAVGTYLYLRECIDPPAAIYTRALRHNHSYYSRGVGATWLIHQPR